MGEERMMILKMLEEGKISNEEAFKLLEALDESDFRKEDFNNNNKKQNNTSNENLENKLEQKIKRITENITENATDLTGKILNMVDNIVDNDNFLNFFGNYESKTENIQKDIHSQDFLSITLEGINGKMIISEWEKDKIDISATCRFKRNKFNHERIYSLKQENSKITIKPKIKNNLSASLEVKLPKKNYKLINVNSTNGKLVLMGLNSENIDCTTCNSSINIENVNSDTITTKTKNGKIKIYKTNAKNIDINTSNSSIIVDSDMVKNVSAKTSNGKIYAEKMSFDNDSKINLNTTNGKIEIHNNISSKNNLSIDAKTSLGKIDLSLPDMIYKINDIQNIGSKRILAHSKNYNAKNGIDIIASTSNSSIKIY